MPAKKNIYTSGIFILISCLFFSYSLNAQTKSQKNNSEEAQYEKSGENFPYHIKGLKQFSLKMKRVSTDYALDHALVAVVGQNHSYTKPDRILLEIVDMYGKYHEVLVKVEPKDTLYMPLFVYEANPPYGKYTDWNAVLVIAKFCLEKNDLGFCPILFVSPVGRFQIVWDRSKDSPRVRGFKNEIFFK